MTFLTIKSSWRYVFILDVNEDATVDVADQQFWLTDLKEAHPGDVDLDGTVQFSDFLVLSNNFGKEGDWSVGDFDGDGQVAFADFLILSDNFGATSSAAAAVPEPAAALFAITGVLGLIGFRRRR